MTTRTICGVRWTSIDDTNLDRLALLAEGLYTQDSVRFAKGDARMTQYLPQGYVHAGLLEEDGWTKSDLWGCYSQRDLVWGLEWQAYPKAEGQRTDGMEPFLEFRVRLPSGLYTGAIPAFGKEAYYALFHKYDSPPKQLVTHLESLGLVSQSVTDGCQACKSLILGE